MIKEKITDRPRTLTEIANFYQVDKKTMKKWLECNTLIPYFSDKIGTYYSILHLEIIVKHLGEP